MEQTLAQDLATWAIDNGRFDDLLVQERVGRIAIEQEVIRLLEQWVHWWAMTEKLPSFEGAMRKLFATEAAQRQYGDRLDIRAPAGLLNPRAQGPPTTESSNWASERRWSPRSTGDQARYCVRSLPSAISGYPGIDRARNPARLVTQPP
jgi:Acyl-CoA dehydrogenase, C-terminal domain